MLSANRRLRQLRINPSSKVSNGYAGKFLKAGLNFDWSGREDLNLRPPRSRTEVLYQAEPRPDA